MPRWGAIRIILAALALLLSACAAFRVDEQTTSLSFKLPPELVSKITSSSRSARAAGETAESDGVFIEIALSGSFSQTKTVPLTASTTVTFSKIPVGAKIQAKAEAYKTSGDEEKTLLYTGESEEITVAEGGNTLTLKMKKVASEFEESKSEESEPEESKSEEPESEEPAAEEEVTYTVTFNAMEHGTVTANTETATAGETITLTATADSEYASYTLSVKDAGGNAVSVTADASDSTKCTFAMPASNVTVSAAFYIGTKAPTETKAVGDIVFTDGSATPYSADLELTDEQKAAAIAVIFYAGTGNATIRNEREYFGQKSARCGLGEYTKNYLLGQRWKYERYSELHKPNMHQQHNATYRRTLLHLYTC